jgi:DNA-directed RNA polymerase alpha subunit
MLRTTFFGRKALNEIKEVLAQLDLHLVQSSCSAPSYCSLS